MFNRFIKFITGLKFDDTQCGFKLFKKEIAKDLFKELIINTWAFDVEILLKAKKRGYKIKSIPVVWINDERSKVNTLKDGFNMLKDIIHMKKHL